ASRGIDEDSEQRSARGWSRWLRPGRIEQNEQHQGRACRGQRQDASPAPRGYRGRASPTVPDEKPRAGESQSQPHGRRDQWLETESAHVVHYRVRSEALWRGLLTSPPGLTEGLRFGKQRETFGRNCGTVRRPSHSALGDRATAL